MSSLESLFIGEYILYRPIVPLEIMPNGIKMAWKMAIRQESGFIKKNTVTGLIMILPKILKQNYLILMNGQNYLKHQEQNILFLHPSTMMDSVYGPAKTPIVTGVFPGMRWTLDLKEIY